ncbi:hypothetical protein [Erythrobacter colymbi]|uniref:hypothetical protein n=1 Tax=Erythrobacter colymbi TaxID=1161202 RepID=UPI00117C1C17|nr:hypothetical protein [Erythrobacter colymbi]
MNYFQSCRGLIIARTCLYAAQAGAVSSLSPSPADRSGSPTTTKQGNRTMRMISEKAVALLLAVVMSGTAFQTFIV